VDNDEIITSQEADLDYLLRKILREQNGFSYSFHQSVTSQATGLDNRGNYGAGKNFRLPNVLRNGYSINPRSTNYRNQSIDNLLRNDYAGYDRPNTVTLNSNRLPTIKENPAILGASVNPTLTANSMPTNPMEYVFSKPSTEWDYNGKAGKIDEESQGTTQAILAAKHAPDYSKLRTSELVLYTRPSSEYVEGRSRIFDIGKDQSGNQIYVTPTKVAYNTTIGSYGEKLGPRPGYSSDGTKPTATYKSAKDSSSKSGGKSSSSSAGSSGK
jgi:hypothetical protein